MVIVDLVAIVDSQVQVGPVTVVTLDKLVHKVYLVSQDKMVTKVIQELRVSQVSQDILVSLELEVVVFLDTLALVLQDLVDILELVRLVTQGSQVILHLVIQAIRDCLDIVDTLGNLDNQVTVATLEVE